MREGQRCRNPHCDRKAVHAHHVRFRSDGGPTVHENLVGVCEVCHALVHSGLLRVEGDPSDEMRWIPLVDQVCSPVFAARDAVDGLPEIRMVRVESGPESGRRSRSDAMARSKASGIDLEALARGLSRLDVRLSDARRRVAAAVDGLADEELTEEKILRNALRATVRST